MAASMVSCVCWEWQRDDGGFSPYIPEVSNAIETSNHAGMGWHHTGSARVYTIDFGRMIQRKNNTGYERQVQRKQLMVPSSPSITAFWMWNEVGTNFVMYDIQSSVDIELAHLSGQASVDLSKCTSRLPYTIDFNTMQQTRHGYSTRRKVQRYPLAAGNSIQSLLSLAPGITSLTGLASGGSVTTATATTNATGGGGFNFAPYNSLTNHAPGAMMMNSQVVPPHSTVPSGGQHSCKSGMTGVTKSMKSYPGPATKALASVGVSQASSGGTIFGHAIVPNSSTALSSSHPLALPTSTGSLSWLTSTMLTPSSSSTTTGAVSSSTSLASRTTASSPKKKRRGNKMKPTPEDSSMTATAGACSSSSVKVKTEKPKTARSKRRDRKKVRDVSESFDDETSKFARMKKKKLKSTEDGPCPICMNNLSESSGFEDEDHGSSSPLSICKLRKCGHMLHHPCFVMYIKNSAKSGFQCPTCKKSYGVKTGDMPDGQMDVRTSPGTRLPGHERHGAIQITYNFSPGVHNGRNYSASAFPRTCYLPDSHKGQKVLKLLRVAWQRRLTFTIGTSVTSGMTNTVVWNEIHHKTSIHNHSGHGYPDPTYLDRVMLELAAQGVTDDDEDSNNEQGSSSSSSSEEDEDEEGAAAGGGALAAVGGVKGNSRSNAIVLNTSSDEDSDL